MTGDNREDKIGQRKDRCQRDEDGAVRTRKVRSQQCVEMDGRPEQEKTAGEPSEPSHD